MEADRASADRLRDRWGYRVAVLSALAGLVTLATAVTTPPRTGPFCTTGCLAYPFADAARFVPRDFVWMYPEVLQLLLFVMLAAVVRHRANAARAVFATTGLALATGGASILIVDYALQLMVLQPGLLAGEGNDLVVISQYNPHGAFIALENTGYAIVGLAFVFLALASDATQRLDRWLRRVWLTGGLITLVALVVMAIAFGADLQYRFEVASISINWLAMIVGSSMLGVRCRRGAAA